MNDLKVARFLLSYGAAEAATGGNGREVRLLLHAAIFLHLNLQQAAIFTGDCLAFCDLLNWLVAIMFSTAVDCCNDCISVVQRILLTLMLLLLLLMVVKLLEKMRRLRWQRRRRRATVLPVDRRLRRQRRH